MDKTYDWIIIGGGITGISVAEVLTRSGKKVKIIEKNSTLSSETTREFHEWIHTGSLYTLKNNQKKIQKTMLGAIDDLFTYYSSFKNMNLRKSSRGLCLEEFANDVSWYNNENIYFKYRIKKRKFNLFWIFRVARSILSILSVSNINWLRNQGGQFINKFSLFSILIEILRLLKFTPKLFTIMSTDFTSNSRSILNDLYENATQRGLTVSLNNSFIKYENIGEDLLVECKNEKFKTKNLVFCNGKNIADIFTSQIKTSYAPMIVTKNVPSHQQPFVELDYYEENCINYIGKKNGVGLMGGISFDNKESCYEYFSTLEKKIQDMWPNAQILKKYIGEKNEVIPNNSPRGYQFFIWNKKNSNVWAIVPGKFTLFSTFATEFYRRAYNKNPETIITDYSDISLKNNIISDTVWSEFNK